MVGFSWKRFLAIAMIVAGGALVAAQEQSVKPGINDHFKNPDLPKFLKTFEGESREIFASRKEIVAACKIREGMAVADVGAGTGLFTRLFAKEAGDKGKVYAVDISRKFLDHIMTTCKDAQITNVQPVLCRQDSAELAANSIDIVFACDTYHHFEFPQRTLATIHRALKPGGQFIVVDFHRIPGKSSAFILGHVRAPREVVLAEIKEAGFKLVGEEKIAGLKENYFLRFEKVEKPSLKKEKPPVGRLLFDDPRARELQEQTSKAMESPVRVANSIGMKLVLIPAGQFDMGPNGSRHRVMIARPFYLGETEVTLGQYRQWKKGHRIDGAADEFNSDDRPAAMVSWDEAWQFCAWLSELPEEKKAGRVYALPTEAQWEWAARAGTTTTRYFGDTDKGQADFSWFNVTYTPNPKNEEKGRGRQPVGRLKPNAFGLYDMLGNVWEWCGDKRTDDEGVIYEPAMRGGSWRSGAFHCTAVAHDPGGINQRGDNIGFRVMCRVK